MDVHYYPHLNHESKTGKEFFVQFLMIFLAVTLGFFAENVRENYAEKAKAKEYAQLLYDDLKADTTVIQRTYLEKAWMEAKFDSAESILASADLYENNEFLYYIDKYLSLNNIFISRDGTYQQLRSSGSLRYIKNIRLSKKITDYYSYYSRYQSIDGNIDSKADHDLERIEVKLFNARDLSSLTNHKGTDFYTLVLRPVVKLKPIYRNTDDLKLFYLKVDHAKNQCSDSRLYLGKLKGYAADIMKDLKKEYKLK